MTDATHDISAEDVAIVTHLQHFVDSAFVFILLHGIHMHGQAFRADLDNPTVAFLGTEVIQHGKLFQSLVPPIYYAVTFIHIFVRHFLMRTFVVKGVDLHKDVGWLILHDGVACLIHILVGDAAIVVQDFVVPFDTHKAAVVLNNNGLISPIRVFVCLFCATRHNQTDRIIAIRKNVSSAYRRGLFQ